MEMEAHLKVASMISLISFSLFYNLLHLIHLQSIRDIRDGGLNKMTKSLERSKNEAFKMGRNWADVEP